MLQRLLEHAGRLLPAAQRYPTERRVRGWLDSKRLERADHVIVSFGKSGRTWMRVMISRLYQQQFALPEGSLIEFGNFHKAHRDIPKILFTHDNYLRDYTGDGGAKTAYARKPVTLLVRHPADITMSQYFQWLHRMRPHKIELNQYPERSDGVTPYHFMLGDSGLPKVNRWLNEWAAAIDLLPKTLIVRYEDLRKDTVTEFSRVADFLGAKATPAQIEDAVEWARFDNMRQREAEAASDSGRLQAADVDNPDSYKTRRAKVGGYADYFDDAQVEVIEQTIAAGLDPRFGYGTPARLKEAAT
jgi:hypothetical protein